MQAAESIRQVLGLPEQCRWDALQLSTPKSHKWVLVFFLVAGGIRYSSLYPLLVGMPACIHHDHVMLHVR